MLDRCHHDEEIVGGEREDFLIAKAVTHSMVPGAVEYVVTTFFEPPIARGGTTLVPPIVRPEIEAATSERGDHLVVYSSGDPALTDALRASGVPCRVYGMRGGPEADEVDGNLEYRPRSQDGFVEDLRTSRGVVTGGGFSLLSEAVYLGKPMLAIPLRGQFEQMMNARYLERDGYGLCAEEVTDEVVERFLDGLDGFEQALPGYEQDGNAVSLETVETRVAADAAGADRKTVRRGKPRGAEAGVNRAAAGLGAVAAGGAGFALWCGQYPTAQVFGATICRGPAVASGSRSPTTTARTPSTRRG